MQKQKRKSSQSGSKLKPPLQSLSTIHDKKIAILVPQGDTSAIKSILSVSFAERSSTPEKLSVYKIDDLPDLCSYDSIVVRLPPSGTGANESLPSLVDKYPDSSILIQIVGNRDYSTILSIKGKKIFCFGTATNANKKLVEVLNATFEISE